MKSVCIFVLAIGILSGCAGRPVSEENANRLVEVYQANYWKLEPCYTAYGRGEKIQLVLNVRTNSSGQVQFAEVDRENPKLSYRSNPEFDECARRVVLGMSLVENGDTDQAGYHLQLPVFFPYKP